MYVDGMNVDGSDIGGRASRTVLVDIDERKLCAQVRGRSTTLVLDCGGAGQGVGGAWGTELEAKLAELTTLVTYDRAGAGRSDGPQARTVADMTDDLHRLLRSLGLPLPAVFAGWSYGGLVIQLYALRYPDDIAGLVFVDPTVSQTPPGSALVRTTSFTLASKLLRLRALVPSKTSRSIRELAGTLAAMPHHMREVADALDQRTLPPVPIRVITAGKRPRMPQTQLAHLNANHHRLATQSPQGRLIIAERATHQIPHDQPEIIIQTVEDVLRQLDAPQAGH
ncbi:alpha/beta fold hydrolase [Nonomuraea endophytica]|uniref:Pimeloyl-ACP methyl ester carboxylesterase n=1 Tax=Nonomuraea endophytica TaxID=714136 RepID=A0A7W8EFD0_9ACTN|nr:alpha/beta hydrolase [Nonomuraea endophytica]MBB5076347.1 pimeloyl-ACP methyl ester carboxylesterase [Nonomuraea endophytica]